MNCHISESRTAKSIKNSCVGLTFYFFNLILQFFSRRIFLDYLGTEILGLNTITNLLSCFNLVELGIGSAMGFTLYKSLYNKDAQTINEIVALQGKLYRRIAYIVITGSVVLMFFFPWIFAKLQLPLWYVYVSFGVFLFSALLGYFVNFKQILLSADQKEYKIKYSYKAIMLVKILIQIFAVKYFVNSYVWWLLLEVVFTIIASYVLHITVKNTYPFIKSCKLSFKELKAKYPTIQTKIGQAFFLKTGGFVLNQTSPIIIYIFSSMNLVALYGNYMLITTGLISLYCALSSGLTASVGNLIAEGNQQRVLSVFDELFLIRFLIITVLCFTMFTLAQPFISLWIGEMYLLPISTLGLITAILYVSVSYYTLESYLNAFGFYSDFWVSIIEIFANIGLSIMLGHLYDLNGILLGVLISSVIIKIGWKSIFLFRMKLRHGLRRYVIIHIKCMLSFIIAACTTYFLLQFFPINPYKNFSSIILYGTVGTVALISQLIALLYLMQCPICALKTRIRIILQ